VRATVGQAQEGRRVLHADRDVPHRAHPPQRAAYGRGIALHQHDEVTGEAIGHGCIRMEEENAKRIADYHVPGVTKVVIEGRAKVKCEESMQCGNPDRL
jgi:lipoprotein-anchoring transpeptidase ErfK/SrfK